MWSPSTSKNRFEIVLQQLNKYDRRTLALAAVLIGVIFFVAFNILTANALKSDRLDLTEDGLYTLSPGTIAVLNSIDEPITLRFYLSHQLTEQNPVYAQYANRVRELLERYAGIAHGKIKLETYAPEPYSQDDDRAMAGGLQGVPVDTAGAVGYFGLIATNSTDDLSVVPLFSPDREQYLEYDLTKIIYSLAHPKKPTIGLYTSLPLRADPARQYQPWPIFRELAQFFNIKSMRGEGRVPDDIDVLLIAHPQNMTDAEIYAIDQFVLRGGKALILVDPHFESSGRDYTKGPPQPGETSSDLPKLFAAWGVDFSADKVVGDRTVAQSVNMTTGDGRTQVTDYLPWLALRDQNFAHDDVTTAQMQRINLASAGFFTLKPGAKTSLKPLLFSTPQSEEIKVEDVNFVPDAPGLLNSFKSEDKEFVLAGRLTGPVKSIYPDGPPWDPIKKPDAAGEPKSDAKPDAKPDAKTDASGDAKPDTKPDAGNIPANQSAAPEKPKYLTESVKPINVVLIGDVDMMVDHFWLQAENVYGRQVDVPIANNAEFLANILDNLSGSDELASLRSRGLSYRPFVVTEKIRRDAEAQYRETEQRIQQELKTTEAKLQELRGGEAASTDSVLSDEQKKEIESFRQNVIVLRQQLRDVQHNLRKDIDSLDTWLKIINIWAMPVLISLVAIALLILRQARRRRSLHAGGGST
jgi:ABC-type uncharacterized transport system involved in gliding motility auxiliary subunit